MKALLYTPKKRNLTRAKEKTDAGPKKDEKRQAAKGGRRPGDQGTNEAARRPGRGGGGRKCLK